MSESIPPTPTPRDDQEAAQHFAAAFESLRQQVGQVIVGQEQVVEELMLALASRGHAILVGVPGLAKTLLVSTVARALDLEFRRIQFTPDLLPADLIGTQILPGRPRDRRAPLHDFLQGARSSPTCCWPTRSTAPPPKVQSALLEAMQERQVTASATTTMAAPPNPSWCWPPRTPIEQEGTYPLPEAAGGPVHASS